METEYKPTARGFTLIELMIVIAIIAILAAIAIFAYRDYLIRTQVAEGVTLTTRAQLGLAEFYSLNGHMPQGGNGSVGLPQAASISGNYVKSVRVIGGGSGNVLLTFGNQANSAIGDPPHNTCTFTPVTSAKAAVHWKAGCTFPDRYLPQVYRTP